MHSNTRQHRRSEVVRSDSLLGGLVRLRPDDTRHSDRCTLRRLAVDDRHQDHLRRFPGYRSTLPPHLAVQMGTTFVYSGGWIGNVVCLLSSGYLAASSIGWPSCFYTWGSITVLCGISFYLFGKDSPSEYSSIPLDEKEYIEVSLGMTQIDENEKPSTPWMSILRSVPVWALLAAQCAQAWGFWMLLTEIPSYMASIMRFDIKKV